MIDRVRGTIIEYLAGGISADDLATQLPDGWDLDQDGTEPVRLLTMQAFACLAEYQRGDIPEQGLREALTGFVVGSTETSFGGGKTEVREVVPPVVSTRLGSRPLLEVFA
jgi:hypothetical protein